MGGYEVFTSLLPGVAFWNPAGISHWAPLKGMLFTPSPLTLAQERNGGAPLLGGHLSCVTQPPRMAASSLGSQHLLPKQDRPFSSPVVTCLLSIGAVVPVVNITWNLGAHHSGSPVLACLGSAARLVLLSEEPFRWRGFPSRGEK